MMANFKKIGVAAAVASALGASGAAQAVVQGIPGDALLIPFVYMTSATAPNGASVVNTMISIVAASPANVNVDQFPTLTGPKTTSGCNGALHWYFFNKESVEVADGTIPVTCEDWVGIDWASVVTNPSRPFPSAVGVPGYLVVADNAASTTRASGMILYGAAYQIAGNWASQAYIPVLPLIDDVDTAPRDELTHRGNTFVLDANPVTAGMLLPSAADEVAAFSLRYYLYTTPPTGTTTFVLWFPDNSDARKSQSILVYDDQERAVSARTSIPYELNLLKVENGATASAPWTGVVADGLADTGFVLFDVQDYSSDSTTNGFGSRAGVAFSLIGVNGALLEQVQTELAHERGVQ